MMADNNSILLFLQTTESIKDKIDYYFRGNATYTEYELSLIPEYQNALGIFKSQCPKRKRDEIIVTSIPVFYSQIH